MVGGSLQCRSSSTSSTGRGLCRKVAFETICAMVSPGNLRWPEREDDDGNQFQGSAFSAGYHSHGCTVVCRLSFELSPCRRTDGGAWGAGRPCDHPALGGQIQPAAGRRLSPPQAPRVGELAHGRNVYSREMAVVLPLSR